MYIYNNYMYIYNNYMYIYIMYYIYIIYIYIESGSYTHPDVYSKRLYNGIILVMARQSLGVPLQNLKDCIMWQAQQKTITQTCGSYSASLAVFFQI